MPYKQSHLWLWSRQQYPPGADRNLPGKDDRRRHQGPGIYIHIPSTNEYDQEMFVYDMIRKYVYHV